MVAPLLSLRSQVLETLNRNERLFFKSPGTRPTVSCVSFSSGKKLLKMTINEKTKLLPKEYQKSYVIPIPQEEDPNNNTSASLIQNYDSYALTKEELNKYIEDPFWNRVRFVCFSLYWILCLVALLCSCYLAAEALDSGLCEVAFDGSGNGSSVLDNGTLPPANPISAAVADNSGVVLRMLNQPSS